MQLFSGRGQWIQVDLRTSTRVLAVVTQGLNYPGVEQEWVTGYKISYGNSTTSLQVIQNESGSDLVSLFDLSLTLFIARFFVIAAVTA